MEDTYTERPAIYKVSVKEVRVRTRRCTIHFEDIQHIIKLAVGITTDSNSWRATGVRFRCLCWQHDLSKGRVRVKILFRRKEQSSNVALVNKFLVFEALHCGLR